jgi:hypothetical protein
MRIKSKSYRKAHTRTWYVRWTAPFTNYLTTMSNNLLWWATDTLLERARVRAVRRK